VAARGDDREPGHGNEKLSKGASCCAEPVEDKRLRVADGWTRRKDSGLRIVGVMKGAIGRGANPCGGHSSAGLAAFPSDQVASYCGRMSRVSPDSVRRELIG